jgi:hypothetical protein
LGKQLEVVDKGFHGSLKKKKPSCSECTSTRENERTFISALDGGTHLASSVLTSPSGIWFRHCSMMRNDWRISSKRIKYLKW